MDLVNINKQKEENKMDIQSPYIKNSRASIEEVRSKIARKAHSRNHEEIKGKILSIKGEEYKAESDNILQQKIFNASKRIVGEEIKKFTEIASKEIGSELIDIEERIGNNLKQEVQNLEGDINKKIEKLNYNIKDLEKRIRDLEILSIRSTVKQEPAVKEKVIIAETIKKEEPKIVEINKIELLNDVEEKVINEREERGSKKDVKVYYASAELREEEEKYINNKIKNIINSFERSGLLFKKNSYVSIIKDLNVEEFLNNKDSEDYRNIDANDKEKAERILTNLMDTLEIDPKENENVDEFLRRAFRVEFQNRNSK